MACFYMLLVAWRLRKIGVYSLSTSFNAYIFSFSLACTYTHIHTFV